MHLRRGIWRKRTGLNAFVDEGSRSDVVGGCSDRVVRGQWQHHALRDEIRSLGSLLVCKQGILSTEHPP